MRPCTPIRFVYSAAIGIEVRHIARTLMCTVWVIFVAGCVSTVNRSEFDKAVWKHRAETINSVLYMGSRDAHHYIRHGHTLGAQTYRLPEKEIFISNPFPLTKDKSKWRALKKHWEGWSINVNKTDYQK